MHDTSLIQAINENLPPVKYPENGCSVRQVSLINDAMGYEFVNHPKHYNKHPSGVECIDIIQWFPFNIGTAIKHLWRANNKPGVDIIQDLEKAKQYIEFEIKRLGSQGE